MSSMRPPMLAGPMPRHTKRFNIGSLDQLIGVGVGLGNGVGGVLRIEGVCAAVAVDEAFGSWACVAKVPSAIATNISKQIAASSPPRSRAERHVSFIWGNVLSIELW